MIFLIQRILKDLFLNIHQLFLLIQFCNLSPKLFYFVNLSALFVLQTSQGSLGLSR